MTRLLARRRACYPTVGARPRRPPELEPAVPIDDAEKLAAGLPSGRLPLYEFLMFGHTLAREQPEVWRA